MYDIKFTNSALNTWTLLRQTWIAANKAIEIKLAKVGLTPEKIVVLWACKYCPPPIVPVEIGRLSFRDNQTVAGLLNRMEKDHLVKRERRRIGHRFTVIKMTAKGKEACDPGIAIVKDQLTKFMADLSTEDHEQLQNLLRKMRDKALEELHVELRPPQAYLTEKGIPVNW